MISMTMSTMVSSAGTLSVAPLIQMMLLPLLLTSGRPFAEALHHELLVSLRS